MLNKFKCEDCGEGRWPHANKTSCFDLEMKVNKQNKQITSITNLFVYFSVHALGHDFCHHTAGHCLYWHCYHTHDNRYLYKIRWYSACKSLRSRTKLRDTQWTSNVLPEYLHSTGKTRNDCLCPAKIWSWHGILHCLWSIADQNQPNLTDFPLSLAISKETLLHFAEVTTDHHCSFGLSSILCHLVLDCGIDSGCPKSLSRQEWGKTDH